MRALIAAVIVQAVKDAQSADIGLALDAALWLTGNDVPLWLEAIGLPDVDTWSLVTRGGVTMNVNVLELFNGLTLKQERELRRRIAEALPLLRLEVIKDSTLAYARKTPAYARKRRQPPASAGGNRKKRLRLKVDSGFGG